MYRTETRQVKTCDYDIVTEEVVTPGDAKSGKGGMVQTIEKKVPRYKTVTKKVRVSCGPCVRFYCPKKDCCGTTSESTMRMASAQGSVGSPNIGLIPTMRNFLSLTEKCQSLIEFPGNFPQRGGDTISAALFRFHRHP